MIGVLRFALLGVLSLFPCLVAAADLKFCYDPYPPYTLGTSGEPSGGLKLRVLNEVINRIDGVTASVVLLPWFRCQEAVKSGEIDGILPLFQNEERNEYMAFTDDVFLEQSVFWYDRARFPEGLSLGRDFQDMSHLRLGMLQGGYINKTMEAAFSANRTIQRAHSVEALMLMLQHDRVDLIATDAVVGAYTVELLGLSEKVAKVADPIAVQPSKFGLSRVTGADKHLAAFNQVLEEMRQSGLLEEIQAGSP